MTAWPAEEGIGPADRGLTLGDGLFETLLAEAGTLSDLGPHLARMAQGCAALGLPAPDPAEAERRMQRALQDARLLDARAAVRLTLTAGRGGRGLDRPATLAPTLFASAAPAPAPVGPAMVVVAQVRRNDLSPASRLKTLSYLDNVLARREALAVGADEAMMLNTRGEVTCAAAANIFWLAEGVLYTPALECGALAGVARARVLRAAVGLGVVAREIRAGLEAVREAEAVFLTNSLIGVRCVARLDGRDIAEGHAVVSKIKDAAFRDFA